MERMKKEHSGIAKEIKWAGLVNELVRGERDQICTDGHDVLV